MVGERLGAGAERRAFHVHISAAVVDARLGGLRRADENPPQFAAERFGERDMRHDAASKKRVVQRLLGAVEKLVNHHDVARPVFFLQRADGADADDPLHPEFFQRPDVGAVVQFGREEAVAASVARQENNVAPGQLAREQIVRRRAKRRFDFHPFLIGEAFDVVKAGAANDADAML